MGSAKGRIEPFQSNAQLVRDTVENVGRHVPRQSVELAFVDADHGYESVVASLIAVLPLVTDGGILAGHDFSTYFFETLLAVSMFAATMLKVACINISIDALWWIDGRD